MSSFLLENSDDGKPLVVFTQFSGGKVRGVFNRGKLFQGYPGMLHGGMIAALLDESMVSVLDSAGISALTGSLEIRYLKPVCCEEEVILFAGITDELNPLYHLEAELYQNGIKKAAAKGKFMEVQGSLDSDLK